MYCKVNQISTATAYIYQESEDSTSSCTYTVGKNSGLIDINIHGYIPFDILVDSLTEVTNEILKKDLVPQVNISNRKTGIRPVILHLVRDCNYIPIKGVPGMKFSIWKHAQKNSLY